MTHRVNFMPQFARLILTLPLVLQLVACRVGPEYHRPSSVEIPIFKESKEWKSAQPQSVLSSRWWTFFNDPYLDSLVAQVNPSNQALAQADAQFRQAQALVQGARAALYPTATATAITNRFRAASGQSVAVSGVRSLFGTALSIAWEPDLWGNVRRQVEANQATAQASFATLASMRLSLQALLVQSYVQLRALDAQKMLLDNTQAAYQKTLQILENRYAVGVAAKAELVQAQAQLKAIQAQSLHTTIQRAQLEHAIAVLMGKTPSELSISIVPLKLKPPIIPVGIPSQLLERRPDIANAERQVAAANASIGIAKAAYFPTVNLSGTNGYQSGTLSNLFAAVTRYWALGPAAVALPLFDGGAKSAQLSNTIAAFDASVAAYRQSVLTAFQEVEDNLAALRILEAEMQVQQDAMGAAQLALKLTLNQFKAGTVSYLNVMTAQIAALESQKSLLNSLQQRLDASVLLIKALGGGWEGAKMPAADRVGGEVKWSQFLPIPMP